MKIYKKRGLDIYVVNGTEVAAKSKKEAIGKYVAGFERENTRLRMKLSATYELIHTLEDAIHSHMLPASAAEWFIKQIKKIQQTKGTGHE